MKGQLLWDDGDDESGEEDKVVKAAAVALSEMFASASPETSVIPALEKEEGGTNDASAEETRLEVDISGGVESGLAGVGGVEVGVEAGVGGGGGVEAGVEAGVGGGGGKKKEGAGCWVDLLLNLLHDFLSLFSLSTLVQII